MRGHAITVVLAFAAAIVFAGGLILSGGQAPSFGGGGYTIKAMTSQAASLAPGSDVRIAGLRVGRVASVQRRGTGAVLSLDIDRDQAPIPADSQYDIRLRSLVGENYVELYPGHAKAPLPENGTLGVRAQRDDYVELEQVLDELKGTTRRRAQALLQGVGEGLSGRGDRLNDVIQDASPTLDRLATVITTLDKQRYAVARLIDNVGAIAREVDARGDDVRTIARQGTRTFRAVADRDDALRRTLTVLGPTLDQVRTTTGTLRAVTAGASPVVANLAVALRDLDPAVALLRPAAAEGRGVLRALDTATPPLTGTLARVRSLSGPTAKALPALRGALCQANPLLRYLEPYRRNATSFVQNLASATNYYDANGHAARLLSLVGENSFSPVDAKTSSALDTLLKAGVLQKVNSRGYEPFARPDDVSPPTTGDGANGPSSYRRAYPHVTADC